jgi:hypothetical protein
VSGLATLSSLILRGIGYAQAAGKFVWAHRSSPTDDAVSQDDTMRTAYFANIDELTERFDPLRDAAADEARLEAAREGDYQALRQELRTARVSETRAVLRTRVAVVAAASRSRRPTVGTPTNGA